MTEDELRALIGRSEEDGFRAVFLQYQSYVYAIVWRQIRTVGTAEDAEECVSDVFAAAFLHFDAIAPGALQSYLGTLARHTAVDLFRRRTSQKSRALIPEDEAPDIADGTDIPSEYEQSELSRTLYETVRSLGEPDAGIVIQKYYYGRSAAEIAAASGMKPVTVRVRLSRALKRLRTLLADKGISF